MNSVPDQSPQADFDVMIVGAGISGLGAACHLKAQTPEKTFVILEAFESFGGTWLSHTYPGIRSDSDLYTFGYRFKPWTGAPIATAEEIMAYLGEVIDENELAPNIRYSHKVLSASWSSDDSLWTVRARRTDTGEDIQITARFLWMCQGYYRHLEGYVPDWEGLEDYQGILVHPEKWPSGLDYSGKRVLVIGSGATAATVVPAMAGEAAHVTILQRTPTYFIPALNANELADTLRSLDIPDEWTHEIVRRKMLQDQGELSRRSFEEPETLRQELLDGVRAYVGDELVEKHFTPPYRPWQQRIAFVPDGDLFECIRQGSVSIETGHIERFTNDGVLLKSGKLLEADIVVTATGFNLSALGDIPFTIDGRPLNLAETVTYRGMMFTGVPNLVWVFGYFRASWTLRVDLVGDFVTRLLQHMDRIGAKSVVPRLREEDRNMKLLPWIAEDNFNPGYLQRGMHLLPKRGEKPEWQHNQDYWSEREEFPQIDLSDAAFEYR